MKKTLSIFILSLLIVFALTSCHIIEDYFDIDDHTCVYLDKRVVSPIGCTSDGIVISSCICGRQITDITPATGHSFGEWTTTVEADCITVGRQERICTDCKLVEIKDIPKPSHNYEIAGEQIGDSMYNRYTCLDCNESFSVASGIKIPEEVDGIMLIPRCEGDFSFVIISAGDEEYIRENLKIYLARSSDITGLEYELTSIGEGHWQVDCPGYEGGESYLAERDKGIFFKEWGNRSLLFTVTDEEKTDISISDGIIYLAALEEQDPGYFPYHLEFSDGSGGFFLSLEKADGLNIGDIICVGDAKSRGDILSAKYPCIFGRIKSITSLSDGRSLIMLGNEGLDEILHELDVYSDGPSSVNISAKSSSFEAKFLATLLGDYEFIELVGAFYESSMDFLAMRGLQGQHTTLDDLISAIDVDADSEGVVTKEGMQIKTTVTVRLSQPALHLDTQIGEVYARLSFSAELREGKVRLDLDKNDLSLDVSGRLISGLSLNSDVGIEYSAELPLITRDTEGILHLPNCELARGDEIVDIFELIGTPSSSLCESCGVESFKNSLTVADGDSYHIIGCSKIKITNESVFIEGNPDNGLIPCSDCIVNEGVSEFVRIFEGKLRSIERTDDNGQKKPESIAIAGFTSSICGVDTQVFELFMSPDLGIMETANYETAGECDFSYYYRVIDGELTRFDSIGQIGTDAPGLYLNIKLLLMGYEI